MADQEVKNDDGTVELEIIRNHQLLHLEVDSLDKYSRCCFAVCMCSEVRYWHKKGFNDLDRDKILDL